MTSNKLNERIVAYKRRYKRELTDLLNCLQSEIDAIDRDEFFEPSAGVRANCRDAVACSERLSALNELKD